MKKRTIIKICIGLLSLVLISFVVLVIHINSVTKKNTAENLNQRQLSRIDFKVPVDSAEANKIKNYVAGLNGVDGTYFNIPDGIFTYSYKINMQNSKEVYQKVMQLGNYDAQRFIISAAEAKAMGGCPMKMNDHSFYAYLTAYVTKFLN
jgi:hypothetical protein